MKLLKLFICFFLCFIIPRLSQGQNIEIYGPSGSENFGSTVTVLPNGNYVVTDPFYDEGSTVNVGAVYLYNGSTHSLISTLKGSSTNDRIGNVTVLANGNYLVSSLGWDNGPTANVGSVTWCSGTTGLSGVVSVSNSLIGSTAFDMLQLFIYPLPNGNYVVGNREWDNGAVFNAGAATWCNGTTGRTGVISASNSLVGVSGLQQVGYVTILANSNYVVESSGYFTWCNGATGRIGNVINTTNSLAATGSVLPLSNGNYVVHNVYWDNGALTDVGAVTWCNGTTGRIGTVSAANSLVGSKAGDMAGYAGVVGLTNGNYVVSSSIWDNGTLVDVGAVTWCDGTIGRTGAISASSSLIGTTANDNIGGITPLTNGNYVINSPYWDNGSIADVGAVTFCNGTMVTTGTVTTDNSLYGNTTGDNIGIQPSVALSNGNYVVSSHKWDNGPLVDVGAVTWGDGSVGTSGLVSTVNSLIGLNANDQIGNAYHGSTIRALTNGNYVVGSEYWDKDAIQDAGAATWCNGSGPTSGIVTSANSLTGTSTNDYVGVYFTTLANGNYLVNNWFWNNALEDSVGSATWCDGTVSTSAVVSGLNSLVGNNSRDLVGYLGVQDIGNGRYFVRSNSWDNGLINGGGAVTLSTGTSGISGTITSCNSVLGNVTGGQLVGTYNSVYDYLIVGKRLENTVVIYNPSSISLTQHLDDINVNIGDTIAVPLVTASGCRSAGTVKPFLPLPVQDHINVKTWIEPVVPLVGNRPFVARHYQITPTVNQTTVSAKVTLYFTQQEFIDFNNHPNIIVKLPVDNSDIPGKSNLKISKYGGSSNNGTGLPASYPGPETLIDPDDNDIIYNTILNRWEISFNVTGFSGFFIHTYTGLLPVTILSLNARLIGNDGLLQWTTKDEIDLQSYDIERSIDARNYSLIKNVIAFNQSGTHQYSYRDSNITSLNSKVVYYRLKQKNMNGHYSYSNLVALPIKGNSMVLIYPNPVINDIKTSIFIDKAQQLRYRIIDYSGRILLEQNFYLKAGSSSHSINVSNLPKGTYYFEMTGETVNDRKQFIKL